MSGPATVATLLDRGAAQHPDKTFLLFGGEATSYREMAQRTTRIANALAALGVSRGDRVGIVSGNRPEFLEAWFATARLGAIEVPVNTALRGRFLSYPLAQCGAKYVIIEAELLEHLDAVRGDLPALERVIVIGQESYAALLDGAAEPITTEVPVGDVAVIGYTSGTTGPAKGAMLSHRASWYAGDDARRHRGLTGDDVFSTTLPLFHLNAQHLTTIAILEAGATLALERRFSATTFWSELRASGATHFNVIGAMLGILAGRPADPDEWSERERTVFGGPLSPAALAAGRDRWHVRFVTGYGATEFGIVTYGDADDLPLGSFGKPVPEFEVEIVDDEGNPVAVGVPGELVTRPVRPDSMMSEYFGMPEKTVEAMRNLWFHSGDMGKRDADGFLYFVDRKKDALRRRGENISSSELEFAIRDYPGIVEVAVIGVPSALSEDDVKACIRAEGRFDHAAFLDWAGRTLPKFMVPRYVEVLDDFPRTATQRVEKYRLREAPLTPTTWDAEKGGFIA